MKTIRNITLGLGALLLAAVAVVSCDKYNYTDDLQHLGLRVERLEQMVLETNQYVADLNTLVKVVEERGYVTRVVETGEGVHTITFSTGETVTVRNGRQGRDGQDGKDATFLINVAQDPVDGVFYWTMNGEWLLNGDGEKMRAGAVDGKDGKDGVDGKTASEGAAVVPQVRINSITRNWEVSIDGGQTWTDTGRSADGKDGKDGQDDLFLQIDESADGKSITFVLRDGRTFTVPVIP
ncbi:MAG: hypothetical protein IJ067_07450 [Prevotella sp.]|nr:hypothetical protein [Prevotella sp.]